MQRATRITPVWIRPHNVLVTTSQSLSYRLTYGCAPFRRGAWEIDLLANGDREYVREFLENLAETRPAEYKRMFNLLEFASANGPPHNEQKYRAFADVPGQLAEFKAHQARIPCFFDGQRRIVLTHGFIKKKDRTDPSEIQRAIQLRDAYFMAKKAREQQSRKR